MHFLKMFIKYSDLCFINIHYSPSANQLFVACICSTTFRLRRRTCYFRLEDGLVTWTGVLVAEASRSAMESKTEGAIEERRGSCYSLFVVVRLTHELVCVPPACELMNQGILALEIGRAHV